EAEYLRGLVQEDTGQLAEAALAWERTVARCPGREIAASALWRLGWLAYLAHDWPGAADRWTRLRELAGGQRYRTPAAYWAGRAREQLGARAEAARLFEGVRSEAPRGYYGILAAARLPDKPPAPPSPPVELPRDPARALGADPDVVRIEMLRRLGLPTFAADEMDEALPRAVADAVKLYWLSTAYRQVEHYDLSLRIVRRHFAGLTRSGHPGLPREFWETAYPLGWRDELRDAAARAGIDPLLLAAVVREESAFYPLARSRAADERRRGVRRADGVRGDARVRQARDRVVGGVPPPLRARDGVVRAAGALQRGLAFLIDEAIVGAVWLTGVLWLLIVDLLTAQ